MKKYLLLALLAFSLVATPVFAQSTPDEVRQTIQKLQEEIKRLQELLKGLTAKKGNQCYRWDRNLKIGDKGDDVRNLARALANGGYLDLAGNLESYTRYDERLASAVTAFQQKYASDILYPQGLRFGTGFFGQSTRKMIAQLYGCGIVPQPTGAITVISPNGGETLVKGKEYQIRWSSLSRVDFPTLNTTSGSSSDDDDDSDDDNSTSGSGANAQIAADVSIWLVPHACADDCSRKIAGPVPNTGYFAWYADATPGAYIIQVCSGNNATTCDASDSYFKIISGDSSNKPPVIKKVEGPTTLGVNAQGKWQIEASDPENGDLRYSVRWGDEAIVASGATSAAAPVAEVSQTATFTHTYATAGIYYPTFTVTDNVGGSESTSLTVRVGEVLNLGTAKISVISTDGRTLTNASVSLCQTSGTTGTCTISRKTDGGSVVFEAAPGTYTAKAYADGYKANEGTITLYADRTSYLTIKVEPQTSVNRPPVITGVSAPTSLAVNQVGTFSITATDPENGQLYYYVDFGDRPIIDYGGIDATTGVPSDFRQTTTFTHSYSAMGNYTVKFLVRDMAGNQTTSSVTVNVGNTSSGGVTVLSPNGGEQWVANSVKTLSWSVTAPQVSLPLEIWLDPEPPACLYSNPACAIAIHAPYFLDRTTSWNAPYNWIVGTDINNTAIPAGEYRVRVCLPGNTICDSSNAPFRILTVTT